MEWLMKSKKHSEELQKNQEKLIEEMEENGYANFEEATAARVDYAMEKALFPGEPITTTIHALRACLMDDEDIIYKQTGKKYKKIKKEKPYEHNEKILHSCLTAYILFRFLPKHRLRCCVPL